MAKFNIEVELDWVDGEDGYTIDEEIKEQVVSGIKDALLKKATTEAVEAVDDKIAEKILEAEGTIQATVDQFVANVCEEKIGKIIIPEKKNTLELRMLDESLHEHRQAFLNFAVKAEKKAGKGKTKPVYKRFRQFFDFDKELKKMKNRRKPSRFAGITKLLDREE